MTTRLYNTVVNYIYSNGYFPASLLDPLKDDYLRDLYTFYLNNTLVDSYYVESDFIEVRVVPWFFEWLSKVQPHELAHLYTEHQLIELFINIDYDNEEDTAIH